MSDQSKRYTREYAEQLRKYAATDDAFAHAVAENPTDPAPHLVYADWLSEQGREDDELTQRVHALSKSPDDESLRDHVADHLERHGRGYEATLARLHSGRTYRPLFVRVVDGEVKPDVRPNPKAPRWGFDPEGWWNGHGYGGGYVDTVTGRIDPYAPAEIFGSANFAPLDDEDHPDYDQFYDDVVDATRDRWASMLEDPSFRDRHWRPTVWE
jgi:uncharacterized protein (TIGR02996 family)